MMMSRRKIFTIGETVYDIIFKNGEPEAAKAGGSTLNSSVSLGRLGLPVHFISEFGKDHVGNFIIDFLESNNVSTNHLQLYEPGKTAIALAFLNEKNDASYSFYHNYPELRLQGQFPKVEKDDIVLFGSYFAISHDTRKGVLKFIKQAREAGAIIIYDPNFRHPHLHEMETLRPNIEENIQMADIVRGSHEDFQLIFKTKFAADTYLRIQGFGNPNLVYTQSNKEVVFVSKKLQFTLPVPKVKTFSTIGAGDNFNAGIIYSIYNYKLERKEVLKPDGDIWKKIVGNAIKFGTHVCGSIENYISKEFAQSLKL
jgi:fructokinase